MKCSMICFKKKKCVKVLYKCQVKIGAVHFYKKSLPFLAGSTAQLEPANERREF